MNPLCIAHRGASAEAPENTLRAFERAIRLGADGIELDAQTTADGTAVVFHDAHLRRLTGTGGRLAQLSLARVRRLRVGGEPVPTLAEALSHVGGRAAVQVEIKRGASVGSVVRAIRRAGAADRVILASFEPALLREAAALAPALPRMLIAGPPRLAGPGASALRLLRAMAALGAGGVSVDHRAVDSPAFVEAFRLHGARLWCWTVDGQAAQRRLADWGVDALITNNPGALISLLKD